MLNFNIVEGKDILDEIGEDFVQMYNNGVSRAVICKKLGINQTQFQNLRVRLTRNGRITKVRNPNAGDKKTRKYDKLNPRNYYFCRNTGRFHVAYKNRYYSCFKNEEDAKKFVEMMRECDWDYNKRKEFKELILNV